MRARTVAPPILMGVRARAIVGRALREHARRRGWEILALAVQSNHVHVVIVAGDRSPESTMRSLKAWATRALRGSGIARGPHGLWTRHGSTLYLWKEHEIATAIRYVSERQDHAMRPPT